MQSFLDAVREILVSVLIEEWYYGFALAFLASIGFCVLLEELAKSFSKAVSVVVGFLGLGAYIGLAAALFVSYPWFSAGLLAIAAFVCYLAYMAYRKKDQKQ